MLSGTAGSARRLLAAHITAGRKKAPESRTRTFSSQGPDTQEDCCDQGLDEEQFLRNPCPKRCPPGPRGCPGDPEPFRDHCCTEPAPPPCCVCPHAVEPAPRGCSDCKLPPAPAPVCAKPSHHRGPGDGSPSPYAKWIIAAIGGAAAIGLAAYAASSIGCGGESQPSCPDDVEAFDPCDPCGCDYKGKTGKG